MKKVLFVVSQLSTGGAERVISILANNFALRGYAVHLITYANVPNAYILDKTIQWIKYPPISGNRVKQHLTRMKWIRKYIRDNNIDIYITFEHYYGWTCACNSHVNYITSMRNDPAHDKLSVVERVLRRLNFDCATAVIFQTSEIMKYFSIRIQNHGYIIKNPLPNNLPKGTIKREKRIVSISRLESQKNIPMLLRAFKIVVKQHPDYTLEIYGDGSERKEIEQIIRDFRLEKRVFLKGFRKNVSNEIENAYMYVCTSDYEGLSNALLESMAMGLTVISTDSAGGGAREVINDGVNGFLVPIGDDVQLAQKMNWLIEHREEGANMGEEAKKIRIELSETSICDEWERVMNV